MKFKQIFILTGAGVSAESGLPTFRDENGLWSNFDLEDLATPEGFERNPRLVLDFYNQRRAALGRVAPNPAHQALARLEKQWGERGGQVFVCTQNIDDLHERAGCVRVIHMHGELRKARCGGCQTISVWDGDILPETGCQTCGKAGVLRPHVVWFGEMPLHLEEIYAALNGCDLFVAIGTSGAVHPAASFVEKARGRGAATMEINLAPSDNSFCFEDSRYGPASETVPRWVASLIEAP